MTREQNMREFYKALNKLQKSTYNFIANSEDIEKMMNTIDIQNLMIDLMAEHLEELQGILYNTKKLKEYNYLVTKEEFKKFYRRKAEMLK